MNMIAIDTNVLVYAVSPRSEPQKYAIAVDVLDRAGSPSRGTIAVQALLEFYSVATRKQVESLERAARHVETWSEVFKIVPSTLADSFTAMRLHREHQLAFWDAMIIATCRGAGAEVLVSEDMQDGRQIEGLRIVNPFAPGAASIDALVGLHEDRPPWRR